MNDDVGLEKTVARIHRLIEGNDAVVEWNDHIIDPDNIKQKRQIDVTIKKGGKTTHVECRFHEDKQNVQWIEELIGRRISLNADAMIAVSYSGFTDGAKKKARRYGVILRDFKALSEDEVKMWGTPRRITINFLQYDKVKYFLYYDPSRPINARDISRELMHNLVENAFKMVGEKLIDDSRINVSFTPFGVPIYFEKYDFPRFQVISGEFQGYVRKVQKEFNTPAVVSYGAPNATYMSRAAMVAITPDSEIEIAKHEKNHYVCLDLSKLEIPPNSRLDRITVSLHDKILVSGLEIVGLKERLSNVAWVHFGVMPHPIYSLPTKNK